MALSEARNTPFREGLVKERPLKGGVKIYAGALVCLDAAGFLVPGSANPALVADGRAEGTLDNTAGADGDLTLPVRKGEFRYANSAGVDAITKADIGDACYVVDDQTVAKTSGGLTRPRAGKIVDVDAQGVWVEVGAAPDRGHRKMVLPFFINETDTLAPTNAELVSPVEGVISKLTVIVQKAVTTGGDVTALVGVTAVAGLACTIADGAAKGTIVSDTPTNGDASTVVAVGSRIQIAPGAPFNTAGAVSGFIEITY